MKQLQRKGADNVALDPGVIDGYLSEVKKGNRVAFEDLYRYSRELLYVYALSVTGDRLSAEDAVQEVFIKIWLNAAVDEREKRRSLVISDEMSKKGIRKSHENSVAGNNYVEFILKSLKPSERQVAVMHIYGEYTIREIATLLSIPRTTAQWRYTSALKKLKAAIIREENPNE